MDTTRDLQLPSGCEVGAATLHPHVHDHVHDVGTAVTLPERSGTPGKLDTLKSRGLSKVHDIQRVVSERGTAVKGSLATVQTSVRDGAKTQVTRVNDSMKTSPMKWAGIAAGAGFGLGLIGRFSHWRNKQHRMTPDIVIIESGC
jgi:ElaB/YqjD/DUF883 family membrane-anchored ribosome-binding protein